MEYTKYIMKQFKKPQSIKSKQSQTNIQPPQKKSKLIQSIQQLQKRIQNANDDIKQTQKMLDIDLFLKQQKQKRLQHAKNLTAQYEAQKKIRQQKLYKKFKREDRQQSKQQVKETNAKIQFQNLNIPVINPISILKSLIGERSNDEWVKNGHHYKADQINTEGLRNGQQKMFQNFYKNPQQRPKYDGDVERKHISWKKIQQVAENPLQIQTIPQNIQDNSLIPNDTNSQNILSAVTLIKKQISKETFAQNDKVFIAELFTPQNQITVITDKIILVRQFAHKNVNLGSRSQNLNILWPTLIQKCFNKLMINKNIKHLASSINKTIYTLYGLDPQIVPISNKNVIKQNFYLVLGHFLQQGSVGFMNINNHSTVAYQNRIYVLEEVKEHVEKRGKQQKKQIKFKIKNPWRGKLIDNQNINRFTLLQLLQLFNCLILLRDYTQKWSCLRIHISYFSNGAISVTSNQWTKNPQYVFTITKKMVTRIILRKSGQIGQQKQGIYGFLLFENKQASNKIEAMKMDWLIIKTKSNDPCQATYCAQLPKGSYILIPYCTDQSNKQYQFYTLDFIVQKQKFIQFGKARIFDYNYENKKGSRLNNQNNKIIQSLQSVQKFQRPKIEKVDIPTQFKPKITQNILSELGLNLYKNVQLKHFFIPGLVSNLLINKSIQVEFKRNKADKKLVYNGAENKQLTQQQKAQDLQILIGYDAINDDINQGQMKQYLQQSVGIYDFKDYGLQQEALGAVLEVISQHPQIIQIDLTNNSLNDSAITYLCYSMQKNNRTELRKIKVNNNNFGQIGKRALEGLKSTFKNLRIQGIQQDKAKKKQKNTK